MASSGVPAVPPSGGAPAPTSSSAASSASSGSSDLVIEKPFIFGSCSFWQGKKADEDKQHKWTVYVRGLDNEDLSYFVESVHFQLHDSFPNPKRRVDRPPYEVTEFGWGEFTIVIRVVFRDQSLSPVEFWHSLKLFPVNGPSSTRKPVQVEKYDEFVFKNPSDQFLQLLRAGPRGKLPDNVLKQYFRTSAIAEDEQKQRKKLSIARQKIITRIQQLQSKYKMAELLAQKQVRNLNQLNAETLKMQMQLGGGGGGAPSSSGGGGGGSAPGGASGSGGGGGAPPASQAAMMQQMSQAAMMQQMSQTGMMGRMSSPAMNMNMMGGGGGGGQTNMGNLMDLGMDFK